MELKASLSAEEMASIPHIVSHMFLPRLLPQTEEPNLSEIEDVIVSIFETALDNCSTRQVSETLKTLSSIQGFLTKGFAPKISTAIKSIEDDKLIPIYLRSQNAAFILSKLPNSEDLIFSGFQAAIKSGEIMGVEEDRLICIPEINLTIPNSTMVNSLAFAQQLCFLHSKSVQMATPESTKGGQSFKEVRDVQDSLMVTEWLPSLLANEDCQVSDKIPIITTKIRDEIVLGKKKNIPFRRSGLLMVVKSVMRIRLELTYGKKNGQCMYKAYMLYVLVYVLKLYEKIKPDDWDSLIQMMAKIARRLHKLLELISEKEREEPQNLKLKSEVLLVKSEVSKTLREIRSQMDASWMSISQLYLSNTGTCIKIQDDELKSDTRQILPALEIYLNKRRKELGKCEQTGTTVPIPSCPIRWNHSSFPPINLLNNASEDFIFSDFELWIRDHLKKYCSSDNCSKIRELMQTYCTTFFSKYKGDPVAESKLALSILQCLQVLDQIATEKFPLLRSHSTGINVSELECLLLPHKEEMDLLHSLEAYFVERDSISRFPSLIEDGKPSNQSFSVRFARNSGEMNQKRNDILEQIERNIKAKREEVAEAYKQCEELKRRLAGLTCTYVKSRYDPDEYVHSSYCSKCSLESQFNQMDKSVRPYERSLPNSETYQHAIVFELMIPIEIACLRDMTHFWTAHIAYRKSYTTENIHRNWKDYSPLCTGNKNATLVHLGSTVKATLDSHYRIMSVYENTDNFILNNSMNLFYHGNADPFNFTSKVIKKRCTFSISSNFPSYSGLQWALDSTTHAPNQIYASQVNCPQDLSIPEYLQFGTVRAGHRLQYRNILWSMVSQKQSMDSEPVHQLYCQSLWEVGKRDETVFREDHLDFCDNNFSRAFLQVLDRVLKSIEKNWNEAFVLLNLITIALRILEVCEHLEVKMEASKFLKQCRQTATSWGVTVRKTIDDSFQVPGDEKRKLTLLLVDSAMCACFTFFGGRENLEYVMADSQDLLLWLKGVTTLYDEIYWNPQVLSGYLSVTKKSILRSIIQSGIVLESRINNILEQDSSALEELTRERWNAAKAFHTTWRAYDDGKEEIFYCDQVSSLSDDYKKHVVQIDIIFGKFLVDGFPVSRLPEEIVRDRDYTRTFGTTNFRVQPDLNKVFSTVSKYDNNAYTFYMTGTQLIATELRPDGKQLEMVPVIKKKIVFLRKIYQTFSFPNAVIGGIPLTKLSVFGPKILLTRSFLSHGNSNLLWEA